MAIETVEESPGALTPVADAVTTALAEITKTNNTFTELATTGRELAARYKDVVADVRTVAGYQQIAAIRTELRKAWRYPMQELQKAGSIMLGDIRKQFNERARELIEEAEKAETPFQELLDAEDERKEKERTERAAAEARRVEAHQQALAAIMRIPLDATGLGSEMLSHRIGNAREIVIDDTWEEFEGQALQAKDEALRQLQGMLVAAKSDEDEARELAEAKERLKAHAAEQQRQREEADAKAAADRAAREAAEAETAKLRAQVAAMEAEAERVRLANEQAQRERAEAIQRRIDALPGYGGDLSQLGSAEIRSCISTLNLTPLNADHFGDRITEAGDLAVARLDELRAALADAEAREAEEARQQRATEVERRIQDIHSMGPRVDETAAELRERLTRINAFKVDVSDYDDRADEAVHLLVEVGADVHSALEEALEQERAAVEEAERQRQQAEADRAMRARHMRMTAKAAEMFSLLDDAVSGPSIDDVWMNRAAAIVNYVENGDA